MARKQQERDAKRPIPLPDTIRVGYRTVRVEWMPADEACEDGICGDWSPAKARIRISEGMAPDETQNTLLHEVLHAVIKVANLRFPADLEELAVTVLSNVLLQVLHDNPGLTKAIVEPRPA
jgi:hypothetical protein